MQESLPEALEAPHPRNDAGGWDNHSRPMDAVVRRFWAAVMDVSFRPSGQGSACVTRRPLSSALPRAQRAAVRDWLEPSPAHSRGAGDFVRRGDDLHQTAIGTPTARVLFASSSVSEESARRPCYYPLLPDNAIVAPIADSWSTSSTSTAPWNSWSYPRSRRVGRPPGVSGWHTSSVG